MARLLGRLRCVVNPMSLGLIALVLLIVSAPAIARASQLPIDRPSEWKDAIRALHMGEAIALEPIPVVVDEPLPSVTVASALRALAGTLAELGPSHFQLTIRGHTGRSSTYRFNVWEGVLARKRATSVRDLVVDALSADELGGVTLEIVNADDGSAIDFPPDLPRRRVEVIVERLTLPQRVPPDWAAYGGAPSGEALFGFYGDTSGHGFALDGGRLGGRERGTVDLWFSPEWHALNGYDPALFSITGPEGVRQSVHVLDNRGGLAVWDGTEDGYYAIRVDLQEDRAYHLALTTVGETTRMVVDGVILDQALPVGLSQSDPENVLIGAGLRSADVFRGRIAQWRIWDDAVSPADLSRLRQVAGIPPLDDALRPSLVALTAVDPRTAQLGLMTVEAPLTLAEGWFSPLGTRDFRIQNPVDFERGLAPPVFSPLQADWLRSSGLGDSSVGPGDDVDAATAAGDAEPHPVFAHGPLFKAIASAGIDRSSLALPPQSQATRENRRSFAIEGGLEAVYTEEDEGGITRLGPGICLAADRTPNGDCVGGTAAKRTFPLQRDEFLRGFTWGVTRSGAIRELRIYTNKRASTPRGTIGAEDDPVVERHTSFLPDGVQPVALIVHDGASVPSRPIGLELRPPEGIDRSALTLYSDAGAATRFGRVDGTLFQSLNASPAILQGLDVDAPDYPQLQLLDQGRFRLEGIAADFELLQDHPETKPKENFNDTFVSLSKAVNLQANYVGYDILQMDPLHLTRTGAEKQIFKMPDGETQDYYDANRIFVPRGLAYTPEFTGKQHGTVHTSESYSEFQSSLSNSVSAGVSGKLAPVSFSMSGTMKEARASISGNKISRTQGLSRAFFYDLVLDVPRMELADAFVADVRRLAQNGDYASFVEAYGTHYPTAVVYGGLGVLEIDADEAMVETMRQQGVSAKAEVGVLLDAASQTKASFGFEHDSETSKTFRSIVGNQTENFFWVGGTHAGAEHSSWTVGTDGAVPVHVTLRPIAELLSPVHFADADISTRVNAELSAYVDERMERVRSTFPSDVPDKRWIVEVRTDGVFCSTGDQNSIVKSPVTAGASMFPVILSGMVSPAGVLRNFVPDYSIDPDVEWAANQDTWADCPSFVNVIKASSFMAKNALARFQVDEDVVDDDRTSISVFDRYDIEQYALIDQTAAENKGLRVRYREQVSDDGLDIVPASAVAPSKALTLPEPVTHKRILREALCGDHAGGGDSCPALTPSRLQSLSGRWVSNSFISVPPKNCFFCQTRKVTYSVRIMQ